ncbi:MAG: hypothetical protein PW734_05795 [Verrucomicrobium sp.]|nr:hypothetical protein [Verrucomicrobium sp.]
MTDFKAAWTLVDASAEETSPLPAPLPEALAAVATLFHKLEVETASYLNPERAQGFASFVRDVERIIAPFHPGPESLRQSIEAAAGRQEQRRKWESLPAPASLADSLLEMETQARPATLQGAVDLAATGLRGLTAHAARAAAPRETPAPLGFEQTFSLLRPEREPIELLADLDQGLHAAKDSQLGAGDLGGLRALRNVGATALEGLVRLTGTPAASWHERALEWQVSAEEQRARHGFPAPSVASGILHAASRIPYAREYEKSRQETQDPDVQIAHLGKIIEELQTIYFYAEETLAHHGSRIALEPALARDASFPFHAARFPSRDQILARPNVQQSLKPLPGDTYQA